MPPAEPRPWRRKGSMWDPVGCPSGGATVAGDEGQGESGLTRGSGQGLQNPADEIQNHQRPPRGWRGDIHTLGLAIRLMGALSGAH